MADLPEKYKGLTRLGLHEESAQEMQRLDAIVEKNKIKLGDEVYLDVWAYKSLKRDEEKAERYIERDTQSCIFVCIDNGRVIYIRNKADYAVVLSEAQSKRIPEAERALFFRNSTYRGGAPCVGIADIRRA